MSGDMSWDSPLAASLEFIASAVSCAVSSYMWFNYLLFHHQHIKSAEWIMSFMLVVAWLVPFGFFISTLLLVVVLLWKTSMRSLLFCSVTARTGGRMDGNPNWLKKVRNVLFCSVQVTRGVALHCVVSLVALQALPPTMTSTSSREEYTLMRWSVGRSVAGYSSAS